MITLVKVLYIKEYYMEESPTQYEEYRLVEHSSVDDDIRSIVTKEIEDQTIPFSYIYMVQSVEVMPTIVGP